MNDLFITYSGYFLALISGGFNIWQRRQRREASKKKELRKRRFQVYSDYLSKIDEVNSKLYTAQFSEEMQNKMTELFSDISGAASSDEISEEEKGELQSRFTTLMVENFELLTEWMEEQNKVLDEMNKVRLVASPEVAELLDDYSDAVQSVIQSSVGMPMEFAAKGPGNVELETLLNYGQLMEELNRIKRELHSAMREDIGVE